MGIQKRSLFSLIFNPKITSFNINFFYIVHWHWILSPVNLTYSLPLPLQFPLFFRAVLILISHLLVYNWNWPLLGQLSNILVSLVKGEQTFMFSIAMNWQPTIPVYCHWPATNPQKILKALINCPQFKNPNFKWAAAVDECKYSKQFSVKLELKRAKVSEWILSFLSFSVLLLRQRKWLQWTMQEQCGIFFGVSTKTALFFFFFCFFCF